MKNEKWHGCDYPFQKTNDYSLFDIYIKPFHFAINIALDKERNSANNTIACIMPLVNVRTCASNYPFELGMQKIQVTNMT